MAILSDYFKGSSNLFNIFSCIDNNIKFNKEHPNYFKPEGITLFCGSQGSGKTLSAVQMATKILADYPKAILCTNLNIKNIKNKKYYFRGLEDLEIVQNGEFGVIYFIDEIQTYLNSLLSKDVSLDTIISLCQQRKERKLIIGTSQVYGRVAKPLREQIKNVIICKKLLYFIQFNQLIDSTETVEKDGRLCSQPKKTFIWFHSPKLYNTYDSMKKQYGLTKPDKNVVVINPNNMF